MIPLGYGHAPRGDTSRTPCTTPGGDRLSRGEFLDGFLAAQRSGFDDWARFQREYWHLRLQLVFDRLSSQYEDAGKFEQAIADGTMLI